MDAAIYCRISADREGAGLGVERQRTDCERFAKQRGWRVVGTYVDNDISAYSGKKRPEYRRLLDDVQAGRVEAIIAWHTDRLHRSPRELEEFIDICEAHKVHVETVRAGELDLKTPTGRAVARTLGAWARYESEHHAERLRRKIAELAERGLPSGGGMRCFGYGKDKMTLVPEEASALRDAAERVLAGATLRSICKDWNARGLRTTGAHPWYVSRLGKLLQSPRIGGLIQHPTAGRVHAQWPAIITEQQHDRLVTLLKDPARRTNPGAPRRYLLSGTLRCGECGARLKGHAGKKRKGGAVHRQYECSQREITCGRVSISAHLIEPYVVEAMLSTLERLRLTPVGHVGDDEAADIEDLQADRAQLEELASLYAARSITAQEWIRARADIDQRVLERNRRIAARVEDQRLRDLVEGEMDLRDAWPSLALDQQRAVVSTLLDTITVERASNRPTFEPGRIKPVWRV